MLQHPLLHGLAETIPPPGEPWSISQQVKWLATAAACFQLLYVYTKDEEIRIELVRATKEDDRG